jgi:hypothetical protein
MASSYTDNSGIELIGVGEQSGTWGTTTNNNLEIIDKALNGVTDITVSGDMNIDVDDGDKTSNGHTRVLKLIGSPGSETTLTITDATRQAFYIVHNSTGQNIVFRQRTSGTSEELSAASTTIPNGGKGFIYADGKGSGAANVVDLLDGAAGNLDMLNGSTTATATTIADADRVIINDNGTMVQAAVTDVSTYVNANLVTVPSAITSATATLTPSAAQSIYQKVDTSSNNVALTLAIGSLAIGQYIIVDKTSSSNTLTLSYPSNSQGVSLGSSVSFAIAINQNGTVFTFVETIKY